MENNLLHKHLFTLYEKVNNAINLAKENNLLLKVPYERIRVTKIDYKTEAFQYDWENIEYFNLYDWATDPFITFMDEMKALPEFETVSTFLCNKFEVPEENKRFVKDIGVWGFVRFLVKQIPNGSIHSKNIDANIKIFINDYDTYYSDKKFTWNVQVWMNSLYFESDTINLGNNAVLRKPQKEEFDITRPKSHHIDEFDRIMGKHLPASCVLEFSIKAEVQHLGLYHDDIRKEIENWIDIFRLFKIGNINAIHKSILPTSILEHGTTENPESSFDKSWIDKIGYNETSNYKYLIKEEETELLFTFSEKIKPILQNISQKSYLSGNYLDLAFHRYKDSLLRSEVNVNRMVSAISSLEAMLSDSQMEINFKISIRVAQLLRFFGFDSIKVLDKMKTAYDIRSKLVHGGELKENRLLFSRNYTHEIINFTRICLLISLQLKDTYTRKGDFITKIDQSLIDNAAFIELENLIKEKVSIPILFQYRKDGE